mgnify:CR=1 FL=1
MSKIFTNANFTDEVLKSEKPVLVDFYAVWCGPCSMMAPVVDEIAEEMGDKVVVGKVNVDESKEIAMNYGIRNIPTFLFFKNGEIAEKIVGAVDKSEIVASLDKLLLFSRNVTKSHDNFKITTILILIS